MLFFTAKTHKEAARFHAPRRLFSLMTTAKGRLGAHDRAQMPCAYTRFSFPLPLHP